MTTFYVHGFTFERSGSCQQCGACGCAGCPHHFERDGLSWCDVYEQRAEYCGLCEMDHASCIGYPDNPWIRNIRSGVCGFDFKRADGGSMDDLPFLNGEPWRHHGDHEG